MIIYGHRGVRGEGRPIENTMAAFEAARLAGADGVELDVRTSADGVVVVLHDVDLKRTTGARETRAAKGMTATELAAFEVPTLAEVVEWADAHRLRLNVELKHDAHDFVGLARGVAKAFARRRAAAGRAIVSSFEPKLLALSAVLLPAIPRGFLVHVEQRLAWSWIAIALAKSVRAFAIHPEHWMCTEQMIARWKRAGLAVNAWTVNDSSIARELAGRGVDALITDDPRRMRAAIS